HPGLHDGIEPLPHRYAAADRVLPAGAAAPRGDGLGTDRPRRDQRGLRHAEARRRRPQRDRLRPVAPRQAALAAPRLELSSIDDERAIVPPAAAAASATASAFINATPRT